MLRQKIFTVPFDSQFHRSILPSKSQVRVRKLANSFLSVIRESLVVTQKIFLLFIDSSTTQTLPFFLGKSSRRPDVLPPNPNPTPNPNLTLFQCERVGRHNILDLLVLRQETFTFPFDSQLHRGILPGRSQVRVRYLANSFFLYFENHWS